MGSEEIKQVNITTKNEAQYALPWFVTPISTEGEHYKVRNNIEVKPLINGVNAFGEIYYALIGAKKTVDIICWGFDPSLRIDPGGTIKLGEVLEQCASKNVKVRVLIWYSVIADALGVDKNLTDIKGNKSRSQSTLTARTHDTITKAFKEETKKIRQAAGDLNERAITRDEYEALYNAYKKKEKEFAAIYNRAYLLDGGTSAENKEDAEFNQKWYARVTNNSVNNLEFSTRDMKNFASIYHATKEEDKDMNGQKAMLTASASHHQKMVLVDYVDPINAVGFVMGHNMQKNYRDSSEHAFKPSIRKKAPKPSIREEAPKPSIREEAVKSFIREEGFMPWQDISFRVRGEVLYDLNHNFVKAWEADGSFVAKIIDSKNQLVDNIKDKEFRGGVVDSAVGAAKEGYEGATSWLSESFTWEGTIRAGSSIAGAAGKVYDWGVERKDILIEGAQETYGVVKKSAGEFIGDPLGKIDKAIDSTVESAQSAGRAISNTAKLNWDLGLEKERDPANTKPEDFKLYSQTGGVPYTAHERYRLPQGEMSSEVASKVTSQAQIWRTQPPQGDLTVFAGYKKAFQLVNNLLYTENQYFRHEELTEIVVKKAATRWKGKDKDTEPLYWFVVTNTPNSFAEIDNTHDTLAVIGHEKQLPEYRRVKDMGKELIKERTNLETRTETYRDFIIEASKVISSKNSAISDKISCVTTGKSISEWSAEAEAAYKKDKVRLDEINKEYPRPKTEIDTENARETIEYTDKPGLKVVLACLASGTDDTANDNLYTPVYVHSKFTVVDDGLCILGSANLNVRSMTADSELCIAVADNTFPRDMRKNLWTEHTGFSYENLAKNYEEWNKLMDRNWKNMHYGKTLEKHLVHFQDASRGPGIPLD